MRRFLFLIALTLAPPAHAQFTESHLPPTETQKRRLLVPYVRSATECVAQASLRETDVVSSYKAGQFDWLINRAMQNCWPQLNNMVQAHDQIYGLGTGSIFRDGAYRADLLRAVLARIRPELDRRAAIEDQQRKEREEQEARALEAQRQREAEEREILRKRHIEAQARREAEAETLRKSRDLLRDRFFACAAKEVDSMLAANESAEITSRAAITICLGELSAVIDAINEVIRHDGGAPTAAGSEAIRNALRDIIVATVVKKKAARAGQAATSSARTAPTRSIANDEELVRACLGTVLKAVKGDATGTREGNFNTMISLCRSEIEALGRARALAEGGRDLEAERQAAAAFARDEAYRLLDANA